MKFCKNLQQIVDISDPEWAPYWTNYKMMKKLIKELPSLVPSDDPQRPTSPASVSSSVSSQSLKSHAPTTNNTNTNNTSTSNSTNTHNDKRARAASQEKIGTSPGEIAFFKLLRAELHKASRFFSQANQELGIREERLQQGMEITKKTGSTMVHDKWSSLAKAIYRLYKDLLLLELYAIMTYTSFSKILKKHDKVTGYDTRVKFMANVVNKANFTHYPELLNMIQRCEAQYEQVDKILVTEGRSTSALDEDERLFISMIHRFYGQIMDKAEEEGADVTQRKETLNSRRQTTIAASVASTSNLTSKSKLLTTTSSSLQQIRVQQQQSFKPESNVTSTLKLLVEENDDAKDRKTSACLSDDPDDNRKRTFQSLTHEAQLQLQGQAQGQKPSLQQQLLVQHHHYQNGDGSCDNHKKFKREE